MPLLRRYGVFSEFRICAFSGWPCDGVRTAGRLARRTFRYRPRVGRDCLAHRLTFPLLPFQLLMCDHLATPIEFEALNSAAIAA